MEIETRTSPSAEAGTGVGTEATSQAQTAEELGRGALEWMLAQGRPAPGGAVAWPGVPSHVEPNSSLHQGTGGVVLALLEGWRHFGEDRYADAALRGARYVAECVEAEEHDSLYFGLAGHAFVLRTVQRLLGDEACGTAADRALERVRERFDGERWSEMFELFAGNAGIGLAALAAGDTELALLAVTPYLRTADPTPGGVNWPVRPSPPRSHHMAHGTLGIAYALAAVGRATHRNDLIELALRGAADVVARDEAGGGGFLVPHSDPPHRPDIIERISYGWCNGPAGDAIAFRLLGEVTGDPQWAEYGERCWYTVTRCGLPRRVRPGFWDNSARCCGTAGVLATACDRLSAPGGDDPAFAHVLLADLAARATRNEQGMYWSNFDHTTARDLEPRVGWAHGNAGVIRELLRFARVRSDRDPGYAVAMPDHLNACPA